MTFVVPLITPPIPVRPGMMLFLGFLGRARNDALVVCCCH
jgi:hypothetical protein